ncbi:MAG: DUF1501 domain-containing protein [Cyanobacteria bacterium]|nr:DUF1501 domain-containing protein [Cyanobacteriota bacterium]
MNRRDFLKTGALLSLSALTPEFLGWAYAPVGATSSQNQKLIVIFLRGAVDGLNVLVPYGDPAYYSVRKSISIHPAGQTDGVLDLDGHFGLHPALAPLMSSWKDRSLAFVCCAGSPDPTRSHFDAQDYMESGMPGVKVVSSGWMNRLLKELPDTKSPLRAVNIGTAIPRILQGNSKVTSYAPQVASMRKSVIDMPMAADAFSRMYEGRGDELEAAFFDGVESHETIKSKLAEGGSSPENEMSKEMEEANKGAPSARRFRGFGKQVGKLLCDDPKIQVAFLALGGWDTHVNQGAAKGQLANQLSILGEGLSDLAKGLGKQYKNTTIVVMSEFGRTVKENGNGGTDHGHGNLMWLMGGGINGGKVHGRWSGLRQRDLFEGRDLPVTTDFRAVLCKMLNAQLHLSLASIGTIFPDFTCNDRSLDALFI